MNGSGEGLTVDRLCKEYPTPTVPLPILQNITFSLQRGESMAVMGPSGSGKSTLLYILGALEQPTSGSVRLGADEPFTLNPKQLAAFRNHKIGFVFQDHHLLPQCTALENVLIPTLAEGAGAEAGVEERARGLLERVGLSGRMDHRPAELSGGERQRVAIARALIRRPALLLGDEPTGNLDRKTADSIADLLLELHSEAQSILILVTHSAELAARLPRRAELLDGRLEVA
ncbi:MAG: ATP-binding cassette domain-containing protein [Acidobacteria bacterium]|nr:ATP-binding cassette domain-containing protein [Acidobacteriota bacterium]